MYNELLPNFVTNRRFFNHYSPTCLALPLLYECTGTILKATGVAVRIWLILIVVGFVILGGCGKTPPNFTSPTDGQSFVIESVTQIPITIDSNNYDGVSITAVGMEQVSPYLTFQAGSNGPSAINRAVTTTGTSSFGTSCQTTACIVAIKYAKGDSVREITISFTHQGATTGTTTPTH